MAKLRPITAEMLSNPLEDILRLETEIEEGTQYETAERLMNENSDIIYCNYWDDADALNGGQLTYSIDRKDIANRKRLF